MKRLTVVILVLLIAMGVMAAEGEECLNGEFWREQALTDIIPYWWEHARDEEYGAFYMNLSDRWQASGTDKYPLTISRDVFGFSAAYLLSGEEKYLEAAREGLDYLLEHAWDEEYGGWFSRLSQTGDPDVSRGKNVPYQLYTNVGPTLYYFVSGDERALSHVKESVRIRRTYAYDEEYGGYYYGLNRDLSPRNRNKCKHAHFGYLGSLMPDLCMATRDPELLDWAEELAQLSIERMMDEYGWVGKDFSREWDYRPMNRDGRDVVSSGVELTAANAFLRLYQLTGNELYREHGVALGEQTMHCAWDSEQGGWIEYIERQPPHQPQGSLYVYWWIQCYGSFIQLQLYHITGDERYLDKFKIGAEFWNQYFIDKEYGGVFFSVSPNGSTRSSTKGEVWKTSYHEMEHALLNYLYVNLYVNHQPVVLHFWLKDTQASTKHFVSLVEDPSVQIAGVKINGEPWTDFNAQERSVTLPEASDVKMEVTLAPSGETSVEQICHSQSVIPNQIVLLQNYPNPFNPSTEISFNVPRQSQVKIAIHNVLGQLVCELTDREYAPGVYNVRWNGQDSSNTPVASGVYLYRMTTDAGTITRKMMILR